MQLPIRCLVTNQPHVRALRERGACVRSPAAASVGASAHGRHALTTRRCVTVGLVFVASKQNGPRRGKFGGLFQQEPNPSIERTSQRPLRALCAAAHVER